MSPDETFRVLESSPEGLSAGEAKQRISLFGSNVIDIPERLRGIRVFGNQFRSPLILILVAAGVVTVFLGDWIDTAVIFAAVFANAFLGFWQEYKAERVLELLRSYVRTRVRVRREGKEEEIDAEFLVPGDVIHISRGDRIPADARIISANAFQVDEAVLTGESLPEEKFPDLVAPAAPVPDRTSMVFSGTLAVEGIAEAVVIATDARTEFGKISSLIRAQERSRGKTPLQAALSRFSLFAGVILAFLIATLFVVGIVHRYDPLDMFLISVAVAVSAVPEGLPVALTVILAVGIERLSSRRAVVRRLLAAETLGSTTLILTDKTGTLTEAQVSVREIIVHGGVPAPESKKKILEYALFHSTALVRNPSDPPGAWEVFGNPVDTAVVREAAARGVSLEFLGSANLVERLPFDARRKFAAVCVEENKKKKFVLLGAPDILLPSAVLTEKEKKEAEALVDEKAKEGWRILALLTKSYEGDIAKEFALLSHTPHTREESEPSLSGYTLEGFLVLADPLRKGVKEAIERIDAAGVKTIIVTGDHKGTAEAVARELGIVDGAGAVLTGEDLNSLKKEELFARADETRVYARVTPEQKLMLVNLYKEKGEVVAVTGDGVNDAPALEAADIGVAVGSGTDVAKNVADLVILDNDYETIVEAISEGRRILDNIRKVVVYLLSDSLDELLLIGGSILMGVAVPLNALQILFVNFFSDSFPAIALAFEKGVDDIGGRPRALKRNLFDPEMRVLILVIGVATSFLLFAVYYALLRLGFDAALVRTFTFASFATYTLILAFSLRSLKKSIVEYNPFSNGYLVVGIGIGLTLTLLSIYVPFFQSIFHTVFLPFPWLLGVFSVGLFNIVVVELGKFFFRRYDL